MLDLNRYSEATPRNAIIIQRALRDIDSEPLALALTGLPAEVKQLILRNMSARAARLLEDDIRDLGSRNEGIQEARDLFELLLARHEAEVDREEPPPEYVRAPVPDLRSDDSAVRTLVALAETVRAAGLLTLEGVAGECNDPLLAKGLGLLLDGFDPLVLRATLERYKDSYLHNLGVRMDLVIETIESMGTGEKPLVLEEKLRALVARY